MENVWQMKPDLAGIVIKFPDGRYTTYRIKNPDVRIEARATFDRSKMTFSRNGVLGDVTMGPLQTRYTIRIEGEGLEIKESDPPKPTALTQEEFEA